MTDTYLCPKCGNRHFQLMVTQLADVRFDENGDHEVTEGPYGDLDFDDSAFAICSTNLGGCGHAGALAEFAA